MTLSSLPVWCRCRWYIARISIRGWKNPGFREHATVTSWKRMSVRVEEGSGEHCLYRNQSVSSTRMSRCGTFADRNFVFRFMFRTNDCWGQQGIVVFENIKDTGKKNEMTSNELAKTLTGGMRVLNGEFRFELGAGRGCLDIKYFF